MVERFVEGVQVLRTVQRDDRDRPVTVHEKDVVSRIHQ
jgi:hypothetical protein